MKGPPTGGLASTWQRIETTFFGVAVYVIIDNCILPTRADKAIRTGVVDGVERVRLVLSTAMRAMDAVIEPQEQVG